MNNIEKALEYIKDPIGKSFEEYEVFEKASKEALEKQIPVKPKEGTRAVIAGIEGANCRHCGSIIFKLNKYCDNCGTAIDWSES